ncbi:hypothetical protein BGZ60DRAFT_203560 [Tricladium varicosporioides]|nr:hypothetical protein BGZ60DRAFT_203560 [Hymenoscyphus varicosporioides]
MVSLILLLCSGAIFLLVAADVHPNWPYDCNSTPYCTWWYDNDGSFDCHEILSKEFTWVAKADFLRWNPSISETCGGWAKWQSYCMEAWHEPGRPIPTCITSCLSFYTSTLLGTPEPSMPCISFSISPNTTSGTLVIFPTSPTSRDEISSITSKSSLTPATIPPTITGISTTSSSPTATSFQASTTSSDASKGPIISAFLFFIAIMVHQHGFA